MITSVDELFLAVSSFTRVTHSTSGDFFVVQCDDVWQRGVVLRYLAQALGLHLDQCLYRDGFVYPDDHTNKDYPNVIVYREADPDATRSQENLIPYRIFVEVVGLVGFEDHDPPQDLKLPPVSSLLFDQQPPATRATNPPDQQPVAAGFPRPVARVINPPSETPSQTERRPVYET